MSPTLLAMLLLAAGGDAHCDRVAAYVAAVNDRDLGTMGAMVTDDVAWFAVDGEEISLQSKGRDPLLAGLRDYFAALPSARSTVTACFHD